MENQLITLEIAKIAKNQGFSELVKDYFLVKGEKVTEENTFKENEGMWKDFNKLKNCYSRPSYLLLQKWMREKDINIPELSFLQYMKSDIKHTYLILDKTCGEYKIGRSKNPFQREATLQARQPYLELVAITPKDVEKELHRAYKHLRGRGEYFRLSNRDVLDIKFKYFS